MIKLTIKKTGVNLDKTVDLHNNEFYGQRHDEPGVVVAIQYDDGDRGGETTLNREQVREAIHYLQGWLREMKT